MSLSPTEKRELLSLLAAFCDRASTPDQLRRLREWCKNDGEARQIYLDHLFLDALLHWTLSEELGAAASGVNPAQPFAPARAALCIERAGPAPAAASGALPTTPNGKRVSAGPRLTTAEVEWFIREVPLTDSSCRPPAHRDLQPPVGNLAGNAPITSRFLWLGLAAALSVTLLTLASLVLLGSRQPAHATLIAVAQPQWQGADRVELGDSLPPGKPMRLAYGAVEFEFASGATVVIRGPAEFQLVNGARLLLKSGDMTAHVPPQAAGFTVESAGLVITDLGTEFGVSVGPQGQAQVTVLEGRVEVETPAENVESTRVQTLVAGDSIGRETLQDRLVAVPAPAVDSLPRSINGVRVPLLLNNTGMGIQVGEVDSNWRITRVPDDPNFVAGPALVAADAPPYLPNLVAQDQWLSRSLNLQNSAKGVYVFEYAFDILESVDPNDVVVRARVLVDNALRSVRLNGRDTGLQTPPDRLRVADQYDELVLEHGFVAGRNVLEFDVENFEDSRMALRVLFEASGCLAVERLPTK